MHATQSTPKAAVKGSRRFQQKYANGRPPEIPHVKAKAKREVFYDPETGHRCNECDGTRYSYEFIQCAECQADDDRDGLFDLEENS